MLNAATTKDIILTKQINRRKTKLKNNPHSGLKIVFRQIQILRWTTRSSTPAGWWWRVSPLCFRKVTKYECIFLTLSTLTIWNRWEISEAFVGNLERPDTNLINKIRSSLVNDSRTDHNHMTKGSLGSTSRYLRKQIICYFALGNLFHKHLTYVIPTPNKLSRFVTGGFRGVGKKIG